MHTIGLILVSMVGFSTGCVLALQKREHVPSLWDLLAVIGVWALVFSTKANFGRWSMLGVALLIGIVMGLLVTFARAAAGSESTVIPDSELPEHAREAVAHAELSAWQKFKRGWTRYGERMGTIQGRLLMGFFYFIIVLPFGLLARATSDPLNIKSKPTGSVWSSWDDLTTTLEEAQEQG